MKPYSNITIHHRFSSSVQKEKYLLSYNGQYYEASHAIVELVEELQRYEEEEVAIGAYIRKKGDKYSPEQVREVIEKFIAPIFRAVPKKRTFLYEKELFSAGAIDRFSDSFRFFISQGIYGGGTGGDAGVGCLVFPHYPRPASVQQQSELLYGGGIAGIYACFFFFS